MTTPESGLGGVWPLAPEPAPSPPPAPPPTTGPPPGPQWQARTAEGSGRQLWTRSLANPYEGVNLWLELLSRFPTTGMWPLLVNDRFWEAVEIEPPKLIMTRDPRYVLVGERWLSEQLYGSNFALARELPRGPLPTLIFDADPTDPDELALGAQMFTEVVVVRAAAGWQVPELLGWDGGVNADVFGREHSAVLRRWAGLFGADLMGLTRDEMVLRVRSPARSEHAALMMALECVAYCSDTVFQGVGTLEELAPMATSAVWHFWWD